MNQTTITPPRMMTGRDLGFLRERRWRGMGDLYALRARPGLTRLRSGRGCPGADSPSYRGDRTRIGVVRGKDEGLAAQARGGSSA
jgi:hypothetical protein